jgi:hypothetical protein
MDIISLIKKNYFEILLIICVLFLILYGAYRKFSGKVGTWSSNYTYCGLADSIKYPDNYSKKDSKGERQCRHILESIFNKPFSKYRPNFLRNPVTGNEHNLELDCFNPELRLAVEYNGAQHEKYIPYFHKNKEAFLNQKYRDELKRRMCRDANINLIEVPSTIKLENIEKYIYTKLKHLNYL